MHFHDKQLDRFFDYHTFTQKPELTLYEMKKLQEFPISPHEMQDVAESFQELAGQIHD